MRKMLAIAVAVGVLVPAGSGLFAQEQPNDMAAPPADKTHVRTDDASIQVLIASGISRSPTFRALVTALNDSDVIVYVTPRSMPQGLRGFLVHRIIETGGHRYLRIGVDGRGAKARTIALIAHELQHALEVARVREVGRSRPIEQFFSAIADLRCTTRGDCFETAAAIEIQNAVLRELR
jgi:hypothetical protein